MLDSNGHLHFVGQFEDLIVIQDQNLSPKLYERIIKSHPQCQACIVIPFNGRPLALIELFEKEKEHINEIKQMIKAALGTERKVIGVLQIEDLPKSQISDLKR